MAQLRGSDNRFVAREGKFENVSAQRRAAYARGVARGLKKAGLFLQAESQKETPVDTGNLRNSAFTRAEGTGFNTVVTVGYTANYAIFVHENLNARHPVGNAKFLTGPAKRNEKEIRRIIRHEAGLQ